MTVCIVDTSVFCNILAVPGRSQNRDSAFRDLERHLDAGASLLLPLAVIYETGNHIAHADDGGRRRRIAERFCEEVKKAFTGAAPWSPTPIHDSADLLDWLDEFPDAAMRETSMGDLSIIKIFEEQSRMNPSRRVLIWSYDAHLSSHDRQP